MRIVARSGAVLLALLLLGACSPKLMPTPNIYASGEYELVPEGLSPLRMDNKMELLYVTDRKPIEDGHETLRYGYGRSASLAYGTCVVEIGKDVDWETLVANTTTGKRKLSLPLSVHSVTELGRLAPTPPPLIEVDGKLVPDPADHAQRLELVEDFRAHVNRRLAQTASNAVSIYVHGFHNSFDYAASVLGEFYYFSGQYGVPVLYTWPAGSPGMLRGYQYDRESGQFTIYHLKGTIQTIASWPEVESINIISHSRGTDVVASALRELLMVERAAGRDPLKTLKIKNLVLASPDIDFEVLGQRFGAERFADVAQRVTIYASSEDRALGIAGWLFRSKTRLGQIRPEDLDERKRTRLAQQSNIDIIDARVKTGFVGHNYYHSNPAVSSDLLLLLRYGAKAGSPERPLRELIPGFWAIEDNDYPFVEKE